MDISSLLEKLITTLFLLVFFTSCNNSKDLPSAEDTWKEVQFSTDHNDYIKYIIENPESVYFDTAISSYFFYQQRFVETNYPPAFDCFSNCIRITLDPNCNLLLDGDKLEIEAISDIGFEFIAHRISKHEQPDEKWVISRSSEKRRFSKGSFILTLSSNCQDLQTVIVQASNSIVRYKHYLANEWYGKEYSLLDTSSRYQIDSLTQGKIRLEDYETVQPPANWNQVK